MESELPKAYEPKEVEPRWYAFWLEHGVFARVRSRATRGRLRDADAAAERHGLAAHGPRADVHARGRAGPAHRMRGYNALWQPGIDHAGIATQTVVERQLQARGQDAPRPRPRDVRRARLGSGRRRAAGASASSSACSALGATGSARSSRWTRTCRAAVREAFVRLLRGGAHLPRHAPHQLVTRVRRRCSAISRSRTRRRTASSSSSPTVKESDAAGGATRSSWPRRAPRRCSATPRSPCTPTIRATSTSTARAASPVRRSEDPDHHRRASWST